MADESDIWEELENSVYIHLASTLSGEVVPPSDDDSDENEPLSALRKKYRTVELSSDEEPLINKRRKTENNATSVEAVKIRSLQEARKRHDEFLVHQTTLDNVLGANGFVRVPIRADGNCFFEAATTQIDDVTPVELRDNLCDFLEENQHIFLPFVESNTNFLSSVQDLRREGRWSSDVADLLPLALAEWTQRHVTVFTRKHRTRNWLRKIPQNMCQLYYKRKLSVYNFTVYSLADGKATCFVWDETNGRRGSVEIATCLFLYLKSLPVTVKDVILYSDCCGGQNRNQYLAAAFLYALENIPNIISITHKYLETGHTQMECDSMHSAISFAKKANPVFIPSGWDIIVRMARRTNPYTVIPIRFTQILDFKYLASQIIRNTKVDKNNKRVSWFKMKVIHFCKGQDTMHFKYGFDDSEYHQLCLSSSSARRRQPDLAHIIRPRYTEKLPVSEAKKQDLLSLCRSGVIPEDHHPFYENLPTASSKVDRLEEPDVEDVIEETD
ncbi:hypothetical protein BaRGS_00019518 [Batillaria attramentaria]|uniref:OTU domain-containing protein n=1 Tax=Batillaria attramentaria TaxID=370345 RepID=A0ABD0KPU2_9CAEN